MGLLERDGELATVASRARAAHAGSGSMVLVCGEPGSGKTSFIDEVLPTLADRFRVLSAACDPLSTPRPLGPIRDLGARLGARTDVALRDSEHSHDIFSAAFDDLASEPSVLIVDDLHWSDQGTVDLLRFVLRRIASAPVLVVGALRDEELDLSHPGRGLLGDVARSPVAETIRLAPLSIVAIEALAEDRDVDATTLHQLTGGNPFFVVEMLGHSDGDLPTTVRDAILARTTGIGPSAWDLLNLLTAAPEAIPDRLLPALGIALPALRELDAAGLIQRGARGVDFRHDLCRLAIGSVVPPGAPPALHQRMLSAIEAGPKPDPAVLVHHAIGAGDADRVLRYADDAGRAAARAGAHAEAATFLRLALAEGDDLPEASRADLLERLAAECYLIDQLSDAIDAAREALDLRIATGDLVAASVGHNALSVYEWYNANREGATVHVERALATLDGAPLSDTDATVTLGHALAMQAFLALQATDVDAADGPLARATELARATADVGLLARTGIVGGMRSVIAGDRDGRGAIL
ncbi:MAG: AAA family ATPase, partial [Acidimicrobiia bacterium]|nr:AAA family ATPase [Acidimicrobiia bacterium]